MAESFQDRFDALGKELPPPASPGANFYIPYTITGRLVFMSGQIPRRGDEILHKGRLGENLSIEEGYAAARSCALNLLAQLHAACDGNLDRVSRIIKLTVFVNSTPAFTDTSAVGNGASDLFMEVFGEAGRHTRSAIGVATLPRGVGVEVEAIVELKP
ncbi:enamine deaminase RidA (YjgF/YER057c/UK114 family) [Rhodoligotrophos appendicifer]|uniref:RidA family protein n=1 Tax=Rhodoligotrophos appendicifer TaxID=987056 RepID=UPI001184949F|nr:RidA family protein [Rhodoligotrophos appendicifer]